MRPELEQIEEIFGEAVGKSDAAARAAFLAAACGTDLVLRARIEALLSGHDAAGGFLKLPKETGPDSVPGADVGPYKLLEPIGEGGFAIVFMARQERPLRRLVALKIVKPGMDTKQVIARFDAERQALAMMDHPGIAKVFDAGATESGRPYFAMELVKGPTVTEYCDQQQLSIDERLALFMQVCGAVQHAHQKGVIHRDIKPSNVLVSMHGDGPLIKVIDFGIAKAMQGPLTERTLFTEFRQLIGTPAYMSPEQASGSLDIDTRSDVYSLGVLLYELLSGSPPFDPRDLHSKPFAEMQRILCEVEPPTPSTRFSGQTVEIQSTQAARRHSDAQRLGQRLRGDLDWIVMKALEKDRSRRYATASDLARDLERHLRHEPVEAHKPSARYLFGKFARRNRAALTTGLLVSAAVVTGLIVSTTQAIRATHAERLAEAARAAEAQHRKIAEDQRSQTDSARAAEAQLRGEAERRSAQAEANFRHAWSSFGSYFTSVRQSQLLNRPGQQAVRAEMLKLALNYYRQVIDQYTNDPALGAELADAYAGAGVLHTMIGSHDEARAALRKGIDGYERLIRENPTIARHRANLARVYFDLAGAQHEIDQKNEAESSYRRAIGIREELARDIPGASGLWPRLPQIYIRLGLLQTETDRPSEAEASFRRALEIAGDTASKSPGGGDDWQDVADAYYDLGYAQHRMNRPLQAQESFGSALAAYEKIAGNGHVAAANQQKAAGAHYYLGLLGRLGGRLAESEASTRRALQLFEMVVLDRSADAATHDWLARAHLQLGLLQSSSGQRSEAIQSWTSAAAEFAVAAEFHDPRVNVYARMGDTLALLGQWRQAADAFAQATLAANYAWRPQFQWALLQLADGNEAGYAATCAELLARHGDHPSAATAVGIALACIAGERAVADMDKVVEITQRLADSDPVNPVFQSWLGAAQFRAGRIDEAITRLRKSVPLHSVAALAVPAQLDQIRVSWLTSETILALAYHKAADEQALAKQIEVVRTLVQRFEAANPHYSQDFGEWALPLAVLLAKRNLARLESP